MCVFMNVKGSLWISRPLIAPQSRSVMNVSLLVTNMQQFTNKDN